MSTFNAKPTSSELVLQHIVTELVKALAEYKITTLPDMAYKALQCSEERSSAARFPESFPGK